MTGKNFAAECAIKCDDRKFWSFLGDVVRRKVNSKDEAAQAVRDFCGIASRKELNQGGEPEVKWKRLRGWFVLWLAGHGTNHAGKRHKPNIMGRVAFGRGSMLNANPFPQPDIDQEEETDFDLWEAGWRTAAKNYANQGGPR